MLSNKISCRFVRNNPFSSKIRLPSLGLFNRKHWFMYLSLYLEEKKNCTYHSLSLWYVKPGLTPHIGHRHKLLDVLFLRKQYDRLSTLTLTLTLSLSLSQINSVLWSPGAIMIGPSRHNSHVWLLLAERTDSKDTDDSDYSSLSDDISNTTSYTFRIPVSLSPYLIES